MSGENRYRGCSVDRALKVLIYLTDHRFGADIQELMELTELSRRQVWRILKAINDAGILLVGVRWGQRGSRGIGVKTNVRLMDHARAKRLCGIV